MPNAIVQSRVNPALKREADALFLSIGLSTADAVRLFLQQSVNVGGLPFQPRAKQPNTQTQSAMRELEAGKGKRSKRSSNFYDDLGI